MERILASPADAEIILKLYGLLAEKVMREARAWMTGEFWLLDGGRVSLPCPPIRAAPPQRAFPRQVLPCWEMAAAMVLHGAVSAELFVWLQRGRVLSAGLSSLRYSRTFTGNGSPGFLIKNFRS